MGLSDLILDCEWTSLSPGRQHQLDEEHPPPDVQPWPDIKPHQQGREEQAGERPGPGSRPSPPLQGSGEIPQLRPQAGHLHDRQTSLRQTSVSLQGQTGEIQQGVSFQWPSLAI